MQVQIKPALRQVWRGPATVQIGLDPRYAAVLEGLTEHDRSLLDLLVEGVDAATLPAMGRARQLLRLLGDAGVLVQARAGRATHTRLGRSRARLTPDAAVWSVVHAQRGGDGWELLGARAHRWVEVVGGGRIGLALATTLAGAGIGRVQVRDDSIVGPQDVGPAAAQPDGVGTAQGVAVRTLISRLCGADHGAAPPQGAWGPGPDARRPDVVVRVDHGAADTGAAERLVATDVVHLSIVVREATLVVGPLVVPGSGPCLRCLDLHRGERDRAWPRVLAQLVGEPGRRIPVESASAQLAASLAALQVLAHLDGLHVPAALGATLEVELPDGLVSRREWPAHVACGCTWPPPDHR